jgi:hypothetical protein
VAACFLSRLTVLEEGAGALFAVAVRGQPWERTPELTSQPRKPEPIPEELTDEMTAADICHALEYLSFIDGYGLIRLDHGVRDFLLRAVRQR